MFEDLEDDEFLDDDAFSEEAGAGDESGNRTFVVAAIALGALAIIGILCIGGYIYFNQLSGGGASAQQTEAARAFQQQTQEADAVQMTIEAQSWTATPTETPLPTDTPEPTEVVALPTATEPERPTEDPATATVAALLTQAADQPTQDPNASPVASITVVVTGLPDTGIFDDAGITGLILLAFFALVVIFLARRLRVANR
jgi:hypothetical protein